MSALVQAVGRLLSELHAAFPVAVCPGDWAWTTTLAGGLIGLLPALGATLVALSRRWTGNRYGVGPVLGFALAGLTFTAALPWLAFLGASDVFRGALAGHAGAVGLRRADLATLGTGYCFAPPQAAYLGGAREVREVFGGLPGSGPGVLVGGLLLLVVLPLLALVFVYAQARLACRRGPAWPARLLWLPLLLLVLGTASLSATVVAHLWLGFLPASILGLLAVALVGAPSRSVLAADGLPPASTAPSVDQVAPPLAATPPRGASAPAPRGAPARNAMPPVAVAPPGAGPPGAVSPGGVAAARGGPYRPPPPEYAGGGPYSQARGAGAVPPGSPAQLSPSHHAGSDLPLLAGQSWSSPGGGGPGGGGPPNAAAAPRRPTAQLGQPDAPWSPKDTPSHPARALAADPGPMPETLRRALGLADPPDGQRSGEEALEPPTLPPSRFRRIRPLGSGGFGTVWLAMDTALDRTVAVKAAKVPDAETERRIRREARALAAVHHPNCVRIYDIVADADGELALIMEYVPGRSLSSVIESDGVLPDPAAARLWSTLAGALRAAHVQGVLHRDVKPSNIVVDDAGHPHLIDFGIARSTGDVTLTAAGMVLGTPDYMAPEVAAGKPASPAADAWQLAATISFALAGHPPRGHRDGAVAAMLAAAQGEFCNQLPTRTVHRALLEAALHPDPARRPTLPVIQAHLTRWLAATGQPADAPITQRLQRPPRPPVQPPARPPRPDQPVPPRPKQPFLSPPEQSVPSRPEQPLLSRPEQPFLSRPEQPVPSRPKPSTTPPPASAQPTPPATPAAPPTAAQPAETAQLPAQPAWPTEEQP